MKGFFLFKISAIFSVRLGEGIHITHSYIPFVPFVPFVVLETWKWLLLLFSGGIQRVVGGRKEKVSSRLFVFGGI